MSSINSKSSTDYRIYVSAPNVVVFPDDQRTHLLPSYFSFVFKIIQTRVPHDSDSLRSAVVQERERTLEFEYPLGPLIRPDETLRGRVSTMLSNIQQTNGDDPTILPLPLYHETGRLYTDDVLNQMQGLVPFDGLVLMIAETARYAIIESVTENRPYIRIEVTIEKRNGVTTPSAGEPRGSTLLLPQRMASFDRAMMWLGREIAHIRSLMSPSQQPPRNVPADWAARSAVESLERVERWEGEMECVICMERDLVGERAEIIRMPCSHVFHGQCILRWLDSKHTCPLCRFKLPKEGDDYY